MAKWCMAHHRESFLYEHFEDICDIMKAYDVAVQPGRRPAPGCASRCQRRSPVCRAAHLGELTQIAWKHDVQTMIEGPGHVPMHMIQANMTEQLKPATKRRSTPWAR